MPTQSLLAACVLAGVASVVTPASGSSGRAGGSFSCNQINLARGFPRLQDIAVVPALPLVALADASDGVWICSLEATALVSCKPLIEAGQGEFMIPNANRVGASRDAVVAYDLYSKRLIVKSISGENIAHIVSDRLFGETRDIGLSGENIVQFGPVWEGDRFNPDSVAVTSVGGKGKNLTSKVIHVVENAEASENFDLFFPMQESGLSVDANGGIWVITASEGEVFGYDSEGSRQYSSDLIYDFRVPLSPELKTTLYRSFDLRVEYLCDFPQIQGLEVPIPGSALVVKKEKIGRNGDVGWSYRRVPASDPRWHSLPSPDWADCYTTLRTSSSRDTLLLLYRRRAGDSNASVVYGCTLDDQPKSRPAVGP